MAKQTNRQQPFRSWFPWINPHQRQVSRLPSSPPQPTSQSISPSPDSPQAPPPSSSQQPPSQSISPSPTIPQAPPPSSSQQPPTQAKSPSLNIPQGSTPSQTPPAQSETPTSNNLQPPPSSSAASQSQQPTQEATSQTSQAPSPSHTAPQLQPVTSATSQRPSPPRSTSQSSSQSRPVPQLPPTTQKASHPLSLPLMLPPSPPPPPPMLPPPPPPPPPPRSSQAQQVTQTAFRTPSPPRIRDASQSKETAQVDSRLVSETLPSPSQPKSTPHENQLELKSASKLENVDSLGKTASANPTQYPKSETKLEELEGNITKRERKQDLNSTSSLKAETEMDEIERGKSASKPNQEQETDATKPPRTEEKPEDVKEKPKPKEAPKQDAKALTQLNEDSMEVVDSKQSNKDPDSKSTRIHPHPTSPVKDARISEAEQLENQAMVHKIEPLQNSSTGKETKIAISSLIKGSAFSEENPTLQKEIEDGISRLVQNLSIGNSRKPGSEQNINIITLAGDNKGAIMHVVPKLMIKDDPMHIDRGYPINQKKAEAIIDGRRRLEESSRTPANNLSVNSNIQSINNSILQNSSCSAGNPGIHLTISTEQTDTVKLKARKGSPETYKDESKTTPAQKLTYEPTIRRRCLRGLFLESGESDQENHQKPRRHGCRYSCEDKKKAKVDPNGSSSARNVEDPS